MKPLLVFVLLAALVVTGALDNKDLSSELDRVERLLKKGDVKRAQVAMDALIDGDVLKYHNISMMLYSSDKKTAEPEALRLLVDQNRNWIHDRQLSREERILYHLGRAAAYEKMDLLDEAEAEYRRLLPMDPGSSYILNVVGWFYADNDINPDEALKLTRRAVVLSPNNAMIIDSLGWAHYKLGNYEKAVTILRHAVELAPDDEELRYHLGAAYAKNGQKIEARIELNKALLLDPSMPEPRKLLRRLN